MRRAFNEWSAWRLALASGLAALLLPPYSLRRTRAMIYRLGGCHIAAGSQIAGGCKISHHNLYVGPGSYIGPVCLIVPTKNAPVMIGVGVSIGPAVRLLTVTHDLGMSERRAGYFRDEPIVIGDGTWIGGSVTILAGVTIGYGAVIAAGSVVKDDVPDNTMVGGMPAKFIRELV